MTEDETAIERIVAQMETAWNAGDSAAFCAPFAENVDFVDILGRHHQGRAVVEAGHQQIFATIYQGSRNQYTMETVRFVRPDVAVVFLHARLWSRLGGAVDDPNRDALEGREQSEVQARPTLILAKEQGTWQVVAFQNTKIA